METNVVEVEPFEDWKNLVGLPPKCSSIRHWWCILNKYSTAVKWKRNWTETVFLRGWVEICGDGNKISGCNFYNVHMQVSTTTAQSPTDRHQRANCAVLRRVKLAAESELTTNRFVRRLTTVGGC